MKITMTLPPKKERIQFAPRTIFYPDKKKKSQQKACREFKNKVD
jgi:hypothetical protein